MDEVSEVELKSTFKARQIRMHKLLDFIKEKKRASFTEIYRFMMRKYYLGTTTIDKYLRDLETSGFIKIETTDEYVSNPWLSEPTRRFVVYEGGEENE